MHYKKGIKMANGEINKEVVESFIKNFSEDLIKKYGENASLEKVLYHLVDRGIIPTQRARDFAIVHDFQEVRGTMSTIDWVMSNEVKYNLKDRQIHNVIKTYTPRYCRGKYVTK